jgi:hypothetical protein
MSENSTLKPYPAIAQIVDKTECSESLRYRAKHAISTIEILADQGAKAQYELDSIRAMIVVNFGQKGEMFNHLYDCGDGVGKSTERLVFAVLQNLVEKLSP